MRVVGSVCVCVCVCVWCSGCVLGSGPEVARVQAPLRQFSIWFPICLPPAPPVHPAVIGYLAFQGLFSWNSNGPGGTSGAHTTCCEERPVLLRVPSPAPGALLARLTVPAYCTGILALPGVHDQRIAFFFFFVCVCVCRSGRGNSTHNTHMHIHSYFLYMSCTCCSSMLLHLFMCVRVLGCQWEHEQEDRRSCEQALHKCQAVVSRNGGRDQRIN